MLSTGVLYLYVVTLRDGKQKKKTIPLYIAREGTVLMTSFKLIVTEVGQITQTVTNLYRPAFAHMNENGKKHLVIHFIYLGNKEIYFVFKTCCITCFISRKCCLFHNFIFSAQIHFS